MVQQIAAMLSLGVAGREGWMDLRGNSKIRASVMVASALLALSLGCLASITPAAAATSEELQAQLDEANSQLESANSEAELAGYDLISVSNNLDATNASIAQLEDEIAQNEQKLKTLLDQLAQMSATEYKGGEANLISIVLGSSSLDELISHIHYANQISKSQQQIISDARSLKSELEDQHSSLEQQRSEQEQLVADQKQKKQAADEAAATAQATYDQLSDEVKAQIAAEQAAAAEQARQQAAEAAAQLAAASSSQSSSRSSSGSGGGGSSSSGGGSGGGSSGATPASLQWLIETISGSGYQWSGYNWTGDKSTSSFTCSGVVDFWLGYKSRAHSPETYRDLVGNLTTNVSALSPGDLVFYSYGGRYPGHVGVYIGGGQMIDSRPGSGVAINSVNSMSGFMGGGSL